MFVSESDKTVIPISEIPDGCYIKPLTEISWTYKGVQVEELRDKRTGEIKRHSGVVIADYEWYLVVQTPKGYNICLDKSDIATGWIKVKGYRPQIKRVLANLYQC